MKSIKLSEYFQIVKPDYVFLKLTPTTSTRNYDSDKIIKAVISLYKNLQHRIRKQNNKYFFDVPAKVAYFTYIEKTKVEFYFIIPENNLNLIRDKIGDTWKGVTISRVNEIPFFSEKAIKYKLNYRKEDALSLSVDKRTNTLLSSMLNVIDVLEEGDKVGVFYNFIPVNQFTWRSQYEETIRKLQENYPIDKDKTSLLFAIKFIMSVVVFIADTVLEVFGDMLGSEKANLSILPKKSFELDKATHKKRDSQVVKTQIVVLSESLDRIRADNSAYAVCEAYKTISGDNELTYRRHNKPINPTALNLHTDAIITSPDECQNLIALPGRELLEEHKCIEKIDTHESEVPTELQKGVMCIGENTYRGTTTKAYLTNDFEYRNLALVLIAPTRAGKTTLISNLAKDGIKAGECAILFDFCGNNELSDEVAEVFPKSQTLTIDCGNPRRLQGLGYNEVKSADCDPFIRYKNAKIQTSQLITLVDSINASDKELSAKMDRFLECAALVVFINGGSIKDVFACLQNHVVRHKYIGKITDSQKSNLEEYILSLLELDERNKEGEVVGTRLNAIAGIIDRVGKLKKNTNMELMLKKDCSQNFDLVREIQKNQLICIKIPESEFATEQEKDIICTYWITKLWLALQIRKQQIPDRHRHTKVNIFVDELYQVPHTQDFIRSKLSQMAKFSGKMIISCHYLGQIGIIREELKSANSSYMLIAGCDKGNYRELSEELLPYTVEDLLNLKRYQSLNLLKYEQGYAKFITLLPYE